MKVLLKIDNVNLREAFKVWHQTASQMKFAEELNEVGPITEYVFEQNRTMRNLIDFMKKEHFTEEEVKSTLQGVTDHNERLMHTVVKRFKIGKDEKLKVKYFMFWKGWLTIKRNFRYCIKRGNNMVQFG